MKTNYTTIHTARITAVKTEMRRGITKIFRKNFFTCLNIVYTATVVSHENTLS